jgi:fatty-acyl-CoA synthase
VDSSLNAALAAVVKRQSDAPALWYLDQTLTWREFDERIGRAAAGFRRLGIGSGDVVSLWLPNTPAWLIAFFALARIGAITLATNTRFRSAELQDILLRAKVKALIYWPEYRGIDFKEVLQEVRPRLPALQHVIEYHEAGDVTSSGALSYADVEAGSDSLADSLADSSDPDTPCLLFTTSGTTSKPKLVLHVQGRIVTHSQEAAASFGYSWPGARSLQMVPFCGTYGFIQGMAAVLSGAPMALHHGYDAPLAGRLIRKHGITLTGMTDEMIRRLFQHEQDRMPFPDTRFYVGSRGHELMELAAERGFKLAGVYGSSEVHALFSRRRDDDPPEVRGFGGGPPVSANAKLRARDQETGAILPHGQAGEIEISSQTMFLRYLHDEEATRKAFTDDGYFRTGDLGHTKADGSWSFHTRIGDAMRLSGFLVNPLEIENYVRGCPGVDLCSVVGVEQPGRTVVVAFYTGQPLAEEALREYCMRNMARYKVPSRFVHVTEMPMIASMNTPKLDRKLLRQRAAALLAESIARAQE